MKLNELMSLGDNNGFGGLLNTAMCNLTKLKNHKDQKIRNLAHTTYSILNTYNTNPSSVYDDNHTLIQYVRKLTNSKIDASTLQKVADSLGSYEPSGE